MNKEATTSPINTLKTVNSVRFYLWLPIIMLFCFILVIISALGVNYYDKKQQLIDNSKAFILNDMINLQREMESHIRLNEWQEVNNILSARGTIENYQLLVAIDEKGKVLHATDLSLVDQNINTLPESAWAFLSQQSTKPTANIWLEKSAKKLFVSLPLALNQFPAAKAVSKAGTLFLIYDLSLSYQALWQQTIKSSIPLIVIILTILILIAFFIRHYVLKPIQNIAELTDHFSKSNFYNNDYLLCDVKGQGEMATLACSFNDMIIKRKKHETDLTESYQQLTHTLIELAEQKYAMDQHSIVAITDVKGAITYVNDKFCSISGFSKKELIKQNHRLVNSGFHSKAFYDDLYSTINQGKVWRGEMCNKNKAGQLYWVDATIVPFTGSSNQPTSFIAITTDITKQKKAEERWQFALEGERSAVWDWNVVTNEVFYSKRWKEMLGFQNSEIGGHLSEWEKRIHPDDKAQRAANLHDHLVGKKDFYEHEHRMLCQNGQYKWVLERGKVVAWGADNQPFRVIGTFQDMTENKKMAESLRLSQKMDAIGQLTGGIAHDFNNILGIIMGSLELLQASLVHDQQSEKLLNSALKASCRASKLTSQLLDFSRCQDDEIQVSNINSLLHEMEDIFRHLAGSQIKLAYHLYEPLWPVNVESGDFHDAIVNIIINAHDAMPNGGRITVATKNVLLDDAFCATQTSMVAGEYVEITISDNGCGIPLEIQQKIFDPFYTTKPPGKGTGLGLAMVFGFAKRFNGGVNVYSEVGCGSTFKLFLPKASGVFSKIPAVAETETIAEIAEEEEIEETVLTASEALLLVDDEQALVEVAKESLSRLGYTIFTANNAPQALMVLAKHPTIDLVFSDIVMPEGLNGFELAKQITQKYPTIKILLTSGYAGKAAMEQGFDETDFPLLTKPYNQADLALKIRSLLGETNTSEGEGDSNQKDSFKWKDRFSLGVKSIDDEHQQLWLFLEKCWQESATGKKEDVHTHFNKFIQCVQNHFEQEEQLMKSSFYSGFKNHHQVHQLLIKQLTKQTTKFFKGEINCEDLIGFFHRWFTEHEADLDQEFVNHYVAFKAKTAANNKESCS